MPTQPQTAVLPRLPSFLALALVSLLVGAVFYLSMPDDTLWQRVVEDAGHGPVFAAIAVVLVLLQAPPAGLDIRSLRQYCGVFALAVALGIATELVQGAMPNRNVSASDVLHDAAGAAMGLALVWMLERHRARQRGIHAGDAKTRFAFALALGAFVLLAWQPLQCARVYAARSAAWPALLPLHGEADAAFSRVREATFSHAPLPGAYVRPGDAASVRLDFNAGARPGLQLIEPATDWSRHEQLVLDITNPAPQPVHLVLRILDATHDWTHEDRFNQALVIPARTRTTVRISLEAVATSPRGRRMDMTAIDDVMLFARRPLDAGDLYVTRVWLE